MAAGGGRGPGEDVRHQRQDDVEGVGRTGSIVCLGGGIGATRLWRHLASAVGADRLTVVVNTADDVWVHGVRVCPDLDTVLYGLSGRHDADRGWGVRDETFTCMETMRGLGLEVWFNLGDRDLATHLLRTSWMRDGMTLTAVTDQLARLNGVTATVLPMCDAEVETEVRMADGWVHYQDFLVRHAAAVPVLDIRQRGIERAVVSAEVADALTGASHIIIGPSNPVASILPILGVPGMLAAVRAASAPVIAITPVVRNVPIRDPGEARRAESRARLLAAIGRAHCSSHVARLYAGFVDRFVVDAADDEEAASVAVDVPSCEVVVCPTLTHIDEAAGPALVEAIFAPAGGPRG